MNKMTQTEIKNVAFMKGNENSTKDTSVIIKNDNEDYLHIEFHRENEEIGTLVLNKQEANDFIDMLKTYAKRLKNIK